MVTAIVTAVAQLTNTIIGAVQQNKQNAIPWDYHYTDISPDSEFEVKDNRAVYAVVGGVSFVVLAVVLIIIIKRLK